MPSPECFFDFSSVDNDNTQIDECAQTSFDEIISQASEKIEEEANNQRILIQDLINQLHLPDSLSAD
ncbi:3696_t:CDS:1, partial [Paraglomus occultum]